MAQAAPGLAENASEYKVVEGMQDQVAKNRVKRRGLVRQRQPDVSVAEVDCNTGGGELFCRRDGEQRMVDARDRKAATRQRHRVMAGAAAEVQYPSAFILRKKRQEWIQPLPRSIRIFCGEDSPESLVPKARAGV